MRKIVTATFLATLALMNYVVAVPFINGTFIPYDYAYFGNATKCSLDTDCGAYNVQYGFCCG